MFYGTEVKVNQKKAAVVTMDTDIKLSQAVLDPSTKGPKKEPVCLMAEIQGKSFILAVLDPTQSWQCPLDLMLGAGTEVKFYLRGQGTVHLTGYEFQDDDNFDMSMSSDDDLEQSSDEVDTKHAAKKIKVKSSPQTNGTKNHLAKAVAVGGDVEMDDSEDSDDDTFNSNDVDEEDDDDDEESNSDEDDADCLDELSGSGLDEDDDDLSD